MDSYATSEERIEVLRKFVQKMRDSGYDHGTRIEILKSELVRYYRRAAEDAAGVTPLHRSARDMEETRRLKPMRVKTWFDARRRGGAASRENKSNPYKIKFTKSDIKAFNALKRQQKERAKKECSSKGGTERALERGSESQTSETEYGDADR